MGTTYSHEGMYSTGTSFAGGLFMPPLGRFAIFRWTKNPFAIPVMGNYGLEVLMLLH